MAFRVIIISAIGTISLQAICCHAYRATTNHCSKLAAIAMPFEPLFQKVQVRTAILFAAHAFFFSSFFYVHFTAELIRNSLVELIYLHINLDLTTNQ
ncbi:MAG: hypothetical protein ACJAQ4_001134 [Cryomorphaceae bacterium]|jgi:hypothetical protein